MFRTKIQHEVTLHVADYGGSFEVCKADIAAATKECARELDMLFDRDPKEYEILEVKYQDTDSKDPEQASIYFLCTVDIGVQILFDIAYTLRCDLEAKRMD